MDKSRDRKAEPNFFELSLKKSWLLIWLLIAIATEDIFRDLEALVYSHYYQQIHCSLMCKCIVTVSPTELHCSLCSRLSDWIYIKVKFWPPATSLPSLPPPFSTSEKLHQVEKLAVPWFFFICLLAEWTNLIWYSIWH